MSRFFGSIRSTPARGAALTATFALLILVAGLIVATRAAAQPVTTDCNDFGATLAAATNNEVIELTGVCTIANAGSDAFTLPNVTGLTIEGAAPTDGFDGTGATAAALSGSADGLTLQDLTIKNYALSDADTVSLSVSGANATLPVINDVTFSDDTQTQTVDNGGNGALAINAVDLDCAYTGAATIEHSTFSGDTIDLTDPTAMDGGGGGGASIDLGVATSGRRERGARWRGGIGVAGRLGRDAPSSAGDRRRGGRRVV
jgi:hypothetical protein